MSAVAAHSSRELCSALQSDLFHCLLSTGLCTRGRDSRDSSDAGRRSCSSGKQLQGQRGHPRSTQAWSPGVGSLVLAWSGLVGNCVKVSGSWE